MGIRKNDKIITAPRLWTVLAKCYGAMATFVEDSIASEGLCLSDFAVLEVLLHKGPLPISEIGKKVLLANASMTSAVDRLDNLGLVTRKSDPGDRRIRRVELTAAGRALSTSLFQRHARQLESLMEPLSSSERTALHRGLKKLGLEAEATTRQAVP